MVLILQSYRKVKSWGIIRFKRFSHRIFRNCFSYTIPRSVFGRENSPDARIQSNSDLKLTKRDLVINVLSRFWRFACCVPRKVDGYRNLFYWEFLPPTLHNWIWHDSACSSFDLHVGCSDWYHCQVLTTKGLSYYGGFFKVALKDKRQSKKLWI